MYGVRCDFAGSALTDLRVYDADVLPTPRAFLFEFHVPVFLGKQRMVTTKSDVDARMKASPALTNNNIAGRHFLATIDLHAKAFTLRIAAVLGTAACFLVCHCSLPIRYMTQDQPELRESLAGFLGSLLLGCGFVPGRRLLCRGLLCGCFFGRGLLCGCLFRRRFPGRRLVLRWRRFAGT